MLLGIIIEFLVGILFLYLGFLIWKKEKITLFHDYHYKYVSDEDKPAFCALSGIGVICIGIGSLLSALMIAITESSWSFMAFAAGFVIGISLLIYAGRRYNVK
ncbi:MAG: DUF3784 domain-containing protein [Clostridia bacterium]|nr:DUF3784 domain-containing protein [Clostridia bacterium]